MKLPTEHQKDILVFLLGGWVLPSRRTGIWLMSQTHPPVYMRCSINTTIALRDRGFIRKVAYDDFGHWRLTDAGREVAETVKARRS